MKYSLLKIQKKNISNIISFFTWCIIFVAFVKPEYFGTIPFWDTFFNAIRLLFGVYVVIRLMFRMKLTKEYCFLILFSVSPVLSTIINSGDVFSAIVIAAVIFGSYSLFEQNTFEQLKYKIEILTFVLMALIVINFLTICLCPDGLYTYRGSYEVVFYTREVWFFGFKNNHTPFLLLACFVSVLNLFYNCHNKRSLIQVYLTHFVATITIVKLSAGAGIIAFAVYYICIFMFLHKNKMIVVGFRLAVCTHLILFVLITVFKITVVFSGMLSLLGKDGTASKRIYIWEAVWEHIIQKPIEGYGYMFSSDLLWLQSIAAGATSSHNTLLDILFRGGFITFTLFLCLLFLISSRMQKLCRLNVLLNNYLSISFFAMFITAQSEGFMRAVPIYIMLSLVANCSMNQDYKLSYKQLRSSDAR